MQRGLQLSPAEAAPTPACDTHYCKHQHTAHHNFTGEPSCKIDEHFQSKQSSSHLCDGRDQAEENQTSLKVDSFSRAHQKIEGRYFANKNCSYYIFAVHEIYPNYLSKT